mmetsp:Transcript_13764/g.18789  ORF Transcript_13764/g.18789 Transcript_13764/m.18789 type:complete len:98 (+) Transcript_13764:1018-1311(+)|eukprot:CAMPEP_0170476432 /NCGR_PEP_ID=MMETSP0123-20130129/17836_1 /TAXON_ID=182087 /ORGANISM="Favella ehrenbergii, Strain Fehren 1" /LENGTH=97 /DNA_ID=CAMNT_0010747443 /DNA_START=1267 /DNA_END=1560 /DNA_ORIENTATION=-
MADICAYFKMEEPNVRTMLDAADINKDGKIDYTEFIAAAIDKKKLLSEENLRRAFDTFDRAKLGYIKKWNIQAILGQNEEAFRKTKDFWSTLIEASD